MSNEIEAISKKFDVISEKVEKDVATKREVNELADLVKEMGKARIQHELATKKHNVFGDMNVAKEMCDYLSNVVGTHSKLMAKAEFAKTEMVTKAALDATTDGNGKYSVPTTVSSALNILISEYGVARKYHEVVEMQGNQDLPVATDDAVAAYTANDITNGADTKQTFSKKTLSPKQFLAIYRASGNLMHNSAIQIATMVGSSLARAAGRLEDDTVWLGDGTSTYGSNTGYKHDADVEEITISALSALTIEKLMELKYAAHESVDGVGQFLITRPARPVLKGLKAHNSGGTVGSYDYLFDIEGSNLSLDGDPITVVNRLEDGTTDGDLVALYGDFRKAGKIGVNRGMSIDLDLSVDFLKAGLVWRLVEDFGFVIPLPGACARLVIEEAGS